MNNKENFWTNADAGLLLIRLVFFCTFFLHGFHKLAHGIADSAQILVDGGLPGQLMYFVYISEVLAPVLLVLGIFTRISILTIIVTMIAIFFVLPFPIGLGVHGELNIEVQLYFTVIPLALFFTGPGRYRIMQNKSGNWLLD